ncbi:MAG TPA: lantibiotic dehydratase, partial [Kofleriaceae bacterium]
LGLGPGPGLGLEADPPGGPITRASAACQAQVDALFHAPGPGWPRARYQCPDLMIAAPGADAIERGELLGVLGEVHVGVNTLLAHVAFRLHPDPAAFCAAYDADMERVCIAPIQTGVSRAMNSPLSPRHDHVEFGAARSWRPRSQVHFAGDLYVEAAGDRLVVRSRAAAIEHDIIAFMEQYLGAEAMPHWKPLARRPHTPRITIDQLVISRERWQLEPAAFAELTAPATEPERLRRVDAWARRLGVPRYVFVTVPHEPKPIYVDLSSPILVESFVRLLTKATGLGLSEMLPGHAELWLPDGAGQRYTSELRIAAVDPIAWSANLDLGISGQP